MKHRRLTVTDREEEEEEEAVPRPCARGASGGGRTSMEARRRTTARASRKRGGEELDEPSDSREGFSEELAAAFEGAQEETPTPANAAKRRAGSNARAAGERQLGEPIHELAAAAAEVATEAAAAEDSSLEEEEEEGGSHAGEEEGEEHEARQGEERRGGRRRQQRRKRALVASGPTFKLAHAETADGARFRIWLTLVAPCFAADVTVRCARRYIQVTQRQVAHSLYGRRSPDGICVPPPPPLQQHHICLPEDVDLEEGVECVVTLRGECYIEVAIAEAGPGSRSADSG